MFNCKVFILHTFKKKGHFYISTRIFSLHVPLDSKILITVVYKASAGVTISLQLTTTDSSYCSHTDVHEVTREFVGKRNFTSNIKRNKSFSNHDQLGKQSFFRITLNLDLKKKMFTLFYNKAFTLATTQFKRKPVCTKVLSDKFSVSPTVESLSSKTLGSGPQLVSRISELYGNTNLHGWNVR